MKSKRSILLLAAALAFAACETDLYDPATGHRIARIQGDAQNLNFRSGQVSFSATALNHSPATLAGAHFATAVANGVAVAAAGVGAAFAPASAPLAPTIIRGAAVSLPSTITAAQKP